MANPNIVNVSEIYGNNDFTALTTTEVALINNPASSGKVIKVNSIIASCVNIGTAQVSLNIYSQDDLGGTSYPVVSDVIIPFASSLILVDGSSSIYLTEDQSIGAVSSGNNETEIIASWEEIS